MSAQRQIAEFLRSFQPEGDQSFIPITPEKIALQTGISRETVNKTLFNLNLHGKVELVKDGRRIVGYRNTDKPLDGRGSRSPRRTTSRQRLEQPVAILPTQRLPRSIPTPALDGYADAKVKFERLTQELGPLVKATFEQNAYAEEGLRLKQRLTAIEPQLAEKSRDLEEAERNLRALRGRLHSDMADAVQKNGALASSGD